MSLIPTEKVQTDAMMHADGEAFQLDRADQNELYVHRMNPINYLYDWLLTLDPRGRWGNAWLLPQCGVTEYDEVGLQFIDVQGWSVVGLLHRWRRIDFRGLFDHEHVEYACGFGRVDPLTL